MLVTTAMCGCSALPPGSVGEYYQEAPGDLFIVETSPALHEFYQQINDFSTHEQPSLKVGYRYEIETAPTLSEWLRIDEFRADHLGGA